MKTKLKELRVELAELYAKHDRGDVTDRRFQQEAAELTMSLYRRVIGQRMIEDEFVECEHHTIQTHFNFTQSLLSESSQQATSLFLTNRKLYRLRSDITPDRPPTADSRDHTSVDEIPVETIRSLRRKFQIRIGEILVGVGFFAVALLFYDWLAITGPVLIGLGGLGVLHALILPTRWIEVDTVHATSAADPILIHAIGKKSAKCLVRNLKEKLRHK